MNFHCYNVVDYYLGNIYNAKNPGMVLNCMNSLHIMVMYSIMKYIKEMINCINNILKKNGIILRLIKNHFNKGHLFYIDNYYVLIF